jgi:hypothetical protein
VWFNLGSFNLRSFNLGFSSLEVLLLNPSVTCPHQHLTSLTSLCMLLPAPRTSLQSRFIGHTVPVPPRSPRPHTCGARVGPLAVPHAQPVQVDPGSSSFKLLGLLLSQRRRFQGMSITGAIVVAHEEVISHNSGRMHNLPASPGPRYCTTARPSGPQ